MKQGELGDKFDNMDPLSAGIMFAQDEAWQRLHEQLDRKASKKRYALCISAAAALLLLTVTIFLKVEQDTVKNASHAAVTVNDAQKPATPIDEHNAQLSETTQPSTAETIFVETVPSRVPPPADVHNMEGKIQVIDPILPPSPSIGPTDVGFTQDRPLAASYPIVHLNQLNEPADSLKQINPPIRSAMVAFKEMQVLHINDIQRIEFNLKLVQPEPKSLFEVMTFSRVRNEYTDEGRPSLLRIKMGNH